LLTFAIIAVITLISAVMVIEHKSLVYAAIFLAILGISNAVLFALLGFIFVALFHLAVYVGAAVVFIIFSITMLKESPLMSIPTRALGLIFTTTMVIIVSIMVLNTDILLNIQVPTLVASYRMLANIIVSKYWFHLIIAAVALSVTLIEAITLARREV
jgi:NADH-quinone oxidoreductase subunit J